MVYFQTPASIRRRRDPGNSAICEFGDTVAGQYGSLWPKSALLEPEIEYLI
jgi:hypothetical protein